MKKIYILLSLACLVMFSACSSDDSQVIEETEVAPQQGEKIIVGVGMPVEDATRVNTEDLMNLKWETGDVITCVGYSADGMKIFGTSEFRLISGEGTAAGQFEGTSVPNAAIHKFIYKGKDVEFTHTMWGETTTVDYFNQVQKSPASSANVKDRIHIETPKVNLKSLSGNIPTTIMNSILRLNLRNVPDVIKDANQYVVNVFFNLYNSDSHIGQLTYDGTLTAGGKNYLYMSIDPQLGLPNNSTMRIEIKAGEKTVKASYAVGTGKNYEPGKIYKLLLDYANPGSWKWDVPSEGGQRVPIYAPELRVDDGWTEENTNTDITDLWRCYDFGTGSVGMLIFNNGQELIPSTQTETIDTRVISPEITLKTLNTVNFTYGIVGIDWWTNDSQFKDIVANTHVYVREVGSTVWTKLEGFVSSTDSWGMGNATDSGVMNIPNTFDGKKVQISVTTRSIPYTNVGGFTFNIWDFLVEGQ